MLELKIHGGVVLFPRSPLPQSFHESAQFTLTETRAGRRCRVGFRARPEIGILRTEKLGDPTMLQQLRPQTYVWLKTGDFVTLGYEPTKSDEHFGLTPFTIEDPTPAIHIAIAFVECDGKFARFGVASSGRVCNVALTHDIGAPPRATPGLAHHPDNDARAKMLREMFRRAKERQKFNDADEDERS